MKNNSYDNFVELVNKQDVELSDLKVYAKQKANEFCESALSAYKSRHSGRGYDYYYRSFLDYKHGYLAWKTVLDTIEIIENKDMN